MKNNNIYFIALLILGIISSCNGTNGNTNNKNNENIKKLESVPSEIQKSTATSSILDSLKYTSNTTSIKKGGINDISFSPDGSLILVTSSRGFSLYLIKDLSFVWFVNSARMDTAGVFFNGRFIENGEKILTNGIEIEQQFFYISNTSDGRLLKKIPLDHRMGIEFEIFPDYDHILGGDGNGDLIIYSLNKSMEIKANKNTGFDFFNSDPITGNRVVSTGGDQIDIWDTDGNSICSFNYEELGDIEKGKIILNMASLDDNNKVILLRASNGYFQIDITDVCEKKVINTMSINEGEDDVCSMDASNKGNDTLVAFSCGPHPIFSKSEESSSNTLNLMKISDFGSILKKSGLPIKYISRIKISPNNDRILVADKSSGTILLLDQNGEIISQDSGFIEPD